jgi:hypothetical protein
VFRAVGQGITRGVIADQYEDIGQAIEGVDAVQFARGDERVECEPYPKSAALSARAHSPQTSRAPFAFADFVEIESMPSVSDGIDAGGGV